MTSSIELTHYQHGALPEGFKELLLGIHADAYRDELAAGDEFIAKFPWFVDHWSGQAGFSCVVAFDNGEPVGLAYGAGPAMPGREWWREHLDPAPEKARTFSVSEVMVRPRWRGQGVSRLMHDALLTRRDEDLAVLLVDPDHPKVQALYESWGYRQVGYRRPLPDSPRYAVMIHHLPRPAAESSPA